MFTHLESFGGGFEPKLAIAPRRKAGENWFTVFIAENGGRKSYLLRCLVEAALGKSRYAPDRRSSIQLLLPSELPERVIAISGTPLDRFPRSGTRDLRARRKRPHDAFVYLGPRASNGMAGVAQSERSLIGCLIANRLLLKSRATLLSRVFAFLDLAPYVDVTLARASEKDRFAPGHELDVMFELKQSLEAREEAEAVELANAITLYSGNPKRVVQNLDKAMAKGVRLRVGPNDTKGRRTVGGFNQAMWELLIRLGHVTVASTQFYRSKDLDPVPGEQLSSGQWGWLGAFGALVAEIRDGSLILVDEPENSLHPRWQQEFIRELHAIVSSFSNCQVVVATHSPLIASGVSHEWGSIRTLTRPKRAGSFVRSQEVQNAFGWSASDVYSEIFGLQSTRAPAFLAAANDALKKLSSGATIDAQEREVWIAQFTESCRALPPLDSMRDVLENIIRRLEATGTSPARKAGGKAGE